MNCTEKISLALLLMTLPALGQQGPSPGVTNTRFIEQGQFIGPYQQYLCVICNPSETTLPLNSGLVYQAAKSFSIAMVGYERVEQAESNEAAPSAVRWVGRITQWGSISFTLADQAKAWKIGTDEEPARWKALILVAGIAVNAILDWIAKNPVPSAMPADSERLPLTFVVPGAIGGVPGCVSYPIYGMASP